MAACSNSCTQNYKLTAPLSFRSNKREPIPCTRLALANEQSCRCHRRLGAALLSSLTNSEKVLPTAQKCLLQALLLIAQIVHKSAHIVMHGINGLIDCVPAITAIPAAKPATPAAVPAAPVVVLAVVCNLAAVRYCLRAAKAVAPKMAVRAISCTCSLCALPVTHQLAKCSQLLNGRE